MGILRDFEKRLEGAVEGFFARAFRSGLQPVELAKALQRYTQNYQQVGVDGVFVPNVFRFELNPADVERFSGFSDSLRTELSSVVKRTAADRGWRLQGPVRIELRPSEEVTVGTYELRGKVEAASQRSTPAPARAAVAAAPAPAAVADRTSVMPRPGPGAARAALVASDSGKRFELDGTVTMGRLPECEITLDDPSVSRRHARVIRSGTGWTVEDLGSTNGVKVNGDGVGTAALMNGDTVELGSVRLTFTTEG